MSEESRHCHEKLLKEFDQQNVVYVCRLGTGTTTTTNSTTAPKMLLKMGSSQNLARRMKSLSCMYGVNPVILYVCECDQYLKFEQWLHQQMRRYRVDIPYRSSFGVGKETYAMTANEYLEYLQSALVKYLPQYRWSESTKRIISKLQARLEKYEIGPQQDLGEINHTAENTAVLFDHDTNMYAWSLSDDEDEDECGHLRKDDDDEDEEYKEEEEDDDHDDDDEDEDDEDDQYEEFKEDDDSDEDKSLLRYSKRIRAAKLASAANVADDDDDEEETLFLESPDQDSQRYPPPSPFSKGKKISVAA
jgi:hypothetical protein